MTKYRLVTSKLLQSLLEPPNVGMNEDYVVKNQKHDLSLSNYSILIPIADVGCA